MFRWHTLLLLILCLPAVYCLDTPTYKQFDTALIKVPCINNETYCSNTASCNITILNWIDTVIVNNSAMTNNGNYFNYTLTNTNTTGVYKTQVVCYDHGQNGYSLFDFQITGSGKQETINVTSAILAIIFVIAFMAVFGFLLANNHPFLGVPLIITSFFVLILLISFTSNAMFQSPGDTLSKQKMSELYGLIMKIIIGAIIYAMAYSLIMFVRWCDKYFRNLKLKRMGLSDDKE